MDTYVPVLVCLLLWYILQMPFCLGPALLTPSQPTFGDQAMSYEYTKCEYTVNTIYLGNFMVVLIFIFYDDEMLIVQ